MSFPLVCICIATPKPLVHILNFLDYIKFIVCMFLFYCGVNDISTEALTANIQNHFNLTSPSDQNTPSYIKRRLSPVQLRSFNTSYETSYEDDDVICVFCLERVEGSDEMRKLGNCCHVFHKQCMDQWIDVGQLICPTCRAPLLPIITKNNTGDEDHNRGPLLKFLGRYW